MDRQEAVDGIRVLIKPVLDALEIKIVEIKLTKERGKAVLRISIDKEYGGITIDDCAKANEEIGHLLDTSDLLTESYLLEVSSPSITRPLVNEDDFKRKRGKKVHIITKEALYEENRKEFTGIVANIDSQGVTITSDDDKTYKFPFEAIRKAKVRVKW